MRNIVIFTFVTLAILVTFTEANNVTFGLLGPNSHLLNSRKVRVYHSFWRIKEQDVYFPENGHPIYFNLTAIRVIDHKPKNGGHAYLLNGGPNYKYSHIRLVSERGHGLNYTIQYFI